MASLTQADSGSAWATKTATLIVRLNPDRGISSYEDWVAGPTPFPLPAPSPEGGGQGRASAADARARGTYFSPRAAATLYRRRWHKICEASLDGCSLQSAEIVDFDLELGRLSYGLLHLDLDRTDPLPVLVWIARWSAELIAAVEGLFPTDAFQGTVWHRPFMVTHLVPKGVLPHAPLSSTYRSWSTTLAWLWLAASSTTEQIFPPDPNDESITGNIFRLSADWSAMVLREGAAFLGLSAGSSSPYHAFANVLVRTVYADSFLLGVAQRDALYMHADALSALRSASNVADGLRVLENSLTGMRNEVWWQNLSNHHVCNRLVKALHNQHDLGVLMEQVVADHADWSRIVTANQERRTGVVLGLLSLVAAPFAISYTAAVSLRPPSVGTFVGASVAAVGFVAVSFLTLLGLRKFRRTAA